MKKLFTLAFLFLVFASFVNSQTWTRKLDGRSVWSLGYDGNGNIYAGGLTSSNSRIWKSSNQGMSWDTIYIGAGQSMWDFAFDGNQIIYVANYSTGLLKSTNGGLNFTLIPSTPNFNGKNLQGVKVAHGGFVYVTTSTGFFRSTDHGVTFSETGLTGFNCLPVLVDKDSSNIIYVGVTSATGTGVGVYRSTDHGLTFSDNLLPGANGYNLMQAPNGNLYRITTTSPYTLARSTDKGLTWTSLANLPSAMRGNTYGSFNSIFVAGNGGVFRSSDGGQSFQNFNFTFSSTPLLHVVYPNELITLAGVSGTTNGGVWMNIDYIQNINNPNFNPTIFTLNQNYPNPFNPGTVITYQLNVSSNITLKIFNAMGMEVAILVNEKQNIGRYSVNFDGSGSSSGVYFYQLQLSGNNGENYSETKRMILMK